MTTQNRHKYLILNTRVLLRLNSFGVHVVSAFHMICESMFSRSTVLAEVALERSFPSVCPDVSVQVSFSQESFAAVLAGKAVDVATVCRLLVLGWSVTTPVKVLRTTKRQLSTLHRRREEHFSTVRCQSWTLKEFHLRKSLSVTAKISED